MPHPFSTRQSETGATNQIKLPTLPTRLQTLQQSPTVQLDNCYYHLCLHILPRAFSRLHNYLLSGWISMPFAHLPFPWPEVEPHSLPEVAPYCPCPKSYSLLRFIWNIPNPHSPRLSNQNVLLASADQLVRKPWGLRGWTNLGEAPADRAPGCLVWGS